MTVTWTEAARRRLEEALQRARDAVAAAGEGDAEEVVSDLRRHVEEEAELRGLRVVAEDDARALIAAVGVERGGGAPSSDPPAPPPGSEATAPPASPSLSLGAAILLWPAAVILPVVALVFELVSRMCTEVLFDPLPTLAHGVLVAAVPLGNAWALVALRRGRAVSRGLVFAIGLGLSVAFYYALVFAPLVPLSLMMVMAYGLGLLSLAPLLALLGGLRLTFRLAGLRRGSARVALAGFVCGLVLVLAAGLQGTLTRYSLTRAVEGDPAERAGAVARLRQVGDRAILLRACYERSGQIGSLESFLLGTRTVAPEAARAVYYRVTGEPFNAVPPPKLRGAESLWRDWDGDQGVAAVGGVVRGLGLASSRIDGSVDGAAALGYLEWTLELRNTGLSGAEARAVVALPPGAVVSRATLWVNGEEREAAFGGRASARRAYESVVRRARDPLLVTTAGPDRVLVQCFPVPAGGTMKLRLGITAPLPVETAARARLYLPHFVERNFALDGGAGHGVWIESRAALDAPGLRAERTPAGANGVRGALDDAALARASVRVDRRGLAPEAWAGDTIDPTGEVVQRLERPVEVDRAADVVVLDGSRGLADEIDAVRAVLAEAPKPPTLVLAGDAVTEVAPGELTPDRFRGGADDVPALVRGWDRARRRVLWIHAAQPVLLSSTGDLQQRCERRPDGPEIVALAVTPGPNRILDGLDECPWLRVAPRQGTLAEDVRRLLRGGAADGGTLRPVRERVAVRRAAARAGVETSEHLVRLWALDRTRALARTAADRPAAAELALRYRVVTPLTGAVVLETAAQEAEAGLVPGDPHRVPTVPEPSTVALLAIATAALLVAWRGRVRRAAAP